MSGDRVTGPADLAGLSRRELLDALDAHHRVLVDARHGIGNPQPPGRARAAALDALAYGRALAEAALRHEWLAQVEALEHGATLADVAAASGLDPDEVLAGVRSRVAGQVEHAGMSTATADRILALLERAAGAR